MTDLCLITKDTYNKIPYNILHTFIISQEGSMIRIHSRRLFVLNAKLIRLKNINTSNIKTITYFVKHIKDKVHDSIQKKPNFYSNYEFNFTSPNCDISNNIKIEIKPHFLNKTDISNIILNDKWFVNLTGKPIPKDVCEFVQFEETFALPCRYLKKKVVLETT